MGVGGGDRDGGDGYFAWVVSEWESLEEVSVGVADFTLCLI